MKIEPLGEGEIQHRILVWTALSDTFLDTELDETSYQAIARTLKTSGYSGEELQWMYRNEVAPAFYTNLLDIAGEWAAFHEEIVREEVLAKRGKKLPTLLGKMLFADFLESEWAKIARYL